MQRESCRHLRVQICTLGLQLEQRDQMGSRDEDKRDHQRCYPQYRRVPTERCLLYAFAGHLSELTGGQRSWRRLWDRAQEKRLGVVQNLGRLHLTIRFTDVKSEQRRRCNVNCHQRLSHLIVSKFTG